MFDFNNIVKEARSWVGTPFHHQGRVKGAGVDCIGLVLEVARVFDIKSRATGQNLNELDVEGYSRQPSGEKLKNELSRNLYAVKNSKIRAGDVLLYRFEKYPQHVGISAENNGRRTIIHATEPVGRVVEQSIPDAWQSRLIGAYRFYGANI